MADPEPPPSWFPTMQELEEALEAYRSRGISMPQIGRIGAAPLPTADPDSVIVSIEECGG